MFKHNKYNLFAVLFAVILSCALTSCDGDDDNDVSGSSDADINGTWVTDPISWPGVNNSYRHVMIIKKSEIHSYKYAWEGKDANVTYKVPGTNWYCEYPADVMSYYIEGNTIITSGGNVMTVSGNKIYPSDETYVYRKK